MHSVFLPKAPTNTEKYSYIIRRPLLLKSLYVMSLLCWLGVLLGYIKFFEYNVWYWLIFGPLVLYITLYHFISISINLFYQRFDIKKHNTFRDTYWKANTRLPVIDVFLPVCGEDKKILENTWKGVLTMKNAKKYIIKPIVLDDKGDKNVEKLARKFKFRYLSRPNKGEMKKAGNLKYGYEKTHGEFMIIFDADFCPRHDFIEELLPYMQDKTRGIVQSPQFFDHDENAHKRSALECGAANVQTYFYKIIQTSRDTFGGSICVGSCAIYRRKALDSIGGTAQVEHSEDVHTGFRLISKKWKIKYIPLPLSKGVCPDDLNAYFKQQTRWCSGSMSMLMNKQFWRSKVSAMTKLCYITGFMYYISHPLRLIFILQTFFILLFHANNIGFWNLAVFIPTVITSGLLQYIYIYPRIKVGTLIAHASNTWFYTYTLVGMLCGHVEKWSPSGLKQKNNSRFMAIFLVAGIYIYSVIAGLFALYIYGKIDLTNIYVYPILFWCCLALTYHMIYWFHGLTYFSALYKSERHAHVGFFLKLQKLVLPMACLACMMVTFDQREKSLYTQRAQLQIAQTSRPIENTSDMFTVLSYRIGNHEKE